MLYFILIMLYFINYSPGLVDWVIVVRIGLLVMRGVFSCICH
jgi:hypothetical protein